MPKEYQSPISLNYRAWRAQYDQEVQKAAAAAWLWMMQHPGRTAYLYYSPANGMQFGKLYIVPDGEQEQQPPGILPASPNRILPETQEQITRWIYLTCDLLPMIGQDRCRWHQGSGTRVKRCRLEEGHDGRHDYQAD